MDRLIDKRSPALRLPASLDRPRVILGRTVPLDVGIRLQDPAEPSVANRLEQKLARIVEAMLAHHAELYAAAAGRIDHLARHLEVGGDRLLHLHVLFAPGADLDRLQAEIREGADIDVVDLRMPAKLFVRRHKLAAVLIRELAP